MTQEIFSGITGGLIKVLVPAEVKRCLYLIWDLTGEMTQEAHSKVHQEIVELVRVMMDVGHLNLCAQAVRVLDIEDYPLPKHLLLMKIRELTLQPTDHMLELIWVANFVDFTGLGEQAFGGIVDTCIQDALNAIKPDAVPDWFVTCLLAKDRLGYTYERVYKTAERLQRSLGEQYVPLDLPFQL